MRPQSCKKLILRSIGTTIGAVVTTTIASPQSDGTFAINDASGD